MGFYVKSDYTNIEETIGILIADPHPTEKTHFYIETKDGKKSVFDRTIHELLKEFDCIPVLYSKHQKYAIPHLTWMDTARRLQPNRFWGNN